MIQTCTKSRHAPSGPPSCRKLRSKPGPWLAITLGSVSLLAGGSAAAATTLSAGWNSSCGSRTCFNDHGAYSVTFSSSSFSGPIDVSRLFLDRGILGTMGSQFFNVSFTLNGESLGSWGTWNMGGVAGDDLWFTGQQLTWNPADGDLVLVLQLVAPNGERFSAAGAGGWYAANRAPPEDRRDDPGGPFESDEIFMSGDDPYSPPGEPDAPPPPSFREPGPSAQPVVAGPVPEPSTWLLMIGGFGLAGAALRRRRLAPAT